MALANTKIDGLQKSPFSTSETITPYKDVTNYNNYYEFSTDKYEPAGLAKNFKTRPWTVTIDGAVKKKQVLDVDSIIKMAARKSASIAIVAWKAGRLWFRGSDSRSAN